MATLHSGVRESHVGPEPRVVTADVQAILRRMIKPGEVEGGRSVALVAERARVSTRTVYRVLQADKDTIGLDLADRLCLAAGSHLAACRMSWPDGSITPYVSVD